MVFRTILIAKDVFPQENLCPEQNKLLLQSTNTQTLFSPLYACFVTAASLLCFGGGGGKEIPVLIYAKLIDISFIIDVL